MENNNTEKLFSINAPFVKNYTATHYICALPLLDKIFLTDVPKELRGDLVLEISGTSSGKEILKSNITLSGFCSADYIFGDQNTLVLSLKKYNIMPSKQFVKTLTHKTEAKISVTAEFCGMSASFNAGVKFLPFGLISPDMPPELLCAYVLPGCNTAKRLERRAKQNFKKTTFSDRGSTPKEFYTAQAIYSALVEENLSYGAALREIGDGECYVRDFDTVMSAPIKSVSLTEAALVFCSCAERMSLGTSIIYLRHGAGATKVLIGINIGDKYEKSVICESILELRDRILAKEMFTFDVQTLLGTESTAFTKSITEAAELIFKGSSTLSFSVDVFASRLSKVASFMPGENSLPKYVYAGFESVSKSVQKIEALELLNSVCSYSPYSSVSLGIFLPDEKLCKGEVYTLSALDSEVFCKEPDTISLITSFKGKYPPKKARNNTEMAQCTSKLKALYNDTKDAYRRKKLFAYPVQYMLGTERPSFDKIRSEFSKDADYMLEKVSYADLSGESTAVYVAYGIVELLYNGKKVYCPCVYVPSEIKKEKDGLKLCYGIDTAVVNSSLYSILSEKSSYKCDALFKNADVHEYTEIFKKLCENCTEEAVYHNDKVISFFDLSYTFMKECIEKSDGKDFEMCLETGVYQMPQDTRTEYGRLEAALPFESTYEQRNALKTAKDGSAVIYGVPGTGKETVLANLICRKILTDEKFFVSSKYKDSLYSLQSKFDNTGLSELCLVISDKESTRDKILHDLSGMESDVDFPKEKISGDINSLCSELDEYSDELYARHSFGYSLFECVNEYHRYNRMCEEAENMPVNTDISSLSEKDKNALVETAKKLSNEAQMLSDSLFGKTIKESNLTYIKAKEKMPKNVNRMLQDACEELGVFREKTALVREMLGFSDKTLTDVRSFIAFGEFLELILKSGVDNVSDSLLCANTYRSTKELEYLSNLICELADINKKLSMVGGNVPAGAAYELCDKWSCSEGNLFARNSIIAELKKYLPENSKISHKEAGELFAYVARREEIEKELVLVDSEASALLGEVWRSENTDASVIKRIQEFSCSLDTCLKKIFRAGVECPEKFHSGCAELIKNLPYDKALGSDFILATAAFKKLSSENFKKGLLPEISKHLCCDFYDIKFPAGVLSDTGLSSLLGFWNDNFSSVELVPAYNTVKKESINKGLSAFVEEAEKSSFPASLEPVFIKSIFHALSNYIIKEKKCFCEFNIKEAQERFSELYKKEKENAAKNLILSHRKAFREYISGSAGAGELYSLRKSLESASVSAYELVSKHSRILRIMYPVVMMELKNAYRISAFPETLILLDSEKTPAYEAIPLCARFNNCIFSCIPAQERGSILSALPKGIPAKGLTRVLSKSNGHIAAFVDGMFSANLKYIRECGIGGIHFVKCDNGLYDKNLRANKIEAVSACKTALEASNEYGLENVGVIALTLKQAFEIKSVFELLSAKFSKPEIKEIPVRYIGSMGKFSKECIVLSTAFGKNIYSTTRSFGVLDDIERTENGLPAVLFELLNSGKALFVVSSLEAGEVMTDSCLKGASSLSALLGFAQYTAIPEITKKKDNGKKCHSFREVLVDSLEEKHGCNAVYRENGILTCESEAVIFYDEQVKDTYDRILLPKKELSRRGYNTEFLSLTDSIK